MENRGSKVSQETSHGKKSPRRDTRKDTRLSFHLEREDLAGPMFKKDTLHLVTLLFAATSFGLCLSSMIWPDWFKLYEKSTVIDTEAYSITVYKLWDLSRCKESDNVCFDSEPKTSMLEFHLGMWVFAVQLLCAAGICLVLVNITMQLFNIAMASRSLGIQNTSMLIIAAAGTFLAMGGGVGQYHALWKEPLRDDEGNFLAMCTLPSGLILLSVVGCAACGVFTHVASHGTGAVSRDTRFLYRRVSMAPVTARPSKAGGREPGLERIKELDLSGPPDLSSSV